MSRKINYFYNDVKKIIVSYSYQFNYLHVLCELEQKFLHNRLMKEIFYNRYTIYYRFVDIPTIVEKDFKTRGEEDLNYFGYGDDNYMADYRLRFRSLCDYT